MNERIKTFLNKYPVLFRFLKNIYRGARMLRYFYRPEEVNYAMCYFSAQLHLGKSLGSPMLLNLEPTNICNLKCPICETGSGKLNRQPRIMTLEEFKYVLKQFDKNLKSIFLYFMGEPFLNKHIYKMVKYAAEREIYVSVCTNGESIDAEELVKSGIAEIQFQIGGINQETHDVYRKGGDLKKTLENLKATVQEKKKYLKELGKKKYPLKIILGLILMKQNENQVQEFIKIAKEIGVDEHQIISPCVRNIEQAKEFLPINRKYWLYEEEEFTGGKLKIKTPLHNYCEWIYSTVTVYSNGDVVPCCRDINGDFVMGNLFQQTLKEIWNNNKYRAFRKKLLIDQKEINLCRICSGYGILTLN